MSVPPLAHIGGIPVEEWLPFVVPVLAIFVYVRRRERRRRAQIERLVSAGKRLDTELASTILERLRAAKHAALRAEHVRLLYPPGPDGATPQELARRVELAPAKVHDSLEDLIELGYLERGEGAAGGDGRVWLTAEGFAAAHIAEDVALAAFAADRESAAGQAHLHSTPAA
jgi:hypothetical protein